MSRSRQVVFGSLGVLALGVALAVGALAFGPAKGLGPLPAQALALPADAPFVAGIDVKRLTATEFYKKQMAAASVSRPDAFKELEDKTGLNPERDVDQVVIAGARQAAGRNGVVLVLGRFDEYQLARALESKPGVTWDKQEGTTVYLFDEGAARAARAVAFLDSHALVFGSTALVRTTLANRSRGTGGLASNAALAGLLARVKPGATFWMVGDQSVLANLPTSLPGPGAAAGSGSSLTLPALQSLIVTGDVEPQVALDVIGDTADEAAAKNLADVVRGFVALASLQAQERPELQQIAQAFSVTTSASQVQVSFRITPEVLERLVPGKQAQTTAPAAPAPNR